MGALGFLIGAGLLGGAAASKVAEPRSLVNQYKSSVIKEGWLLDYQMYNKLRLFYNTQDDCTHLAWERYYVRDSESQDVKPLKLSVTERYTKSFFGYDLEKIYYDLYKRFGSQQKAFRILRQIMTRYWCRKVDLDVRSTIISEQSFSELYDGYINSNEFLDPYGQKVVEVGVEIAKNHSEWGNKRAERYIIKSLPECFEGNERPEPIWRNKTRPTKPELTEWIPKESVKNLNMLKNEIELMYGRTLQDMVYHKWMKGDMFIAPGGNPNRAMHPGTSLFVQCYESNYGQPKNLEYHVTGFDFPPANDYEKKVYEDFKTLYD